MAHGFLRGDDAIGLNIEYQLVQVSALLHTGVFYGVADAANGAKRCIKDNAANGVLAAIIAQSADITGLVTTSFFHLDLHFELAIIGQGSDVMIRVNDLYIVGQLDIFGGNLAWTDRKSTRLNSSHVAISYA